MDLCPPHRLLLDVSPQGVARLTINRPEARNAMSAEMALRLKDTLQQLAASGEIRALILRGAGEHLCSGADLSWMRAIAEGSHEQQREAMRPLPELLWALYHFPAPTIVLAKGAVHGAGVGLLAAADIVIANDTLSACFTEAKMGLIPATISPYVVRAIGERQARRYAFTSEPITASRARDIGLVHEVVDPRVQEVTADTLVKHILRNGPEAVRAVKRLTQHVASAPLDQATLEYTLDALAERIDSAEGHAGIQAVLHHATPDWVR